MAVKEGIISKESPPEMQLPGVPKTLLRAATKIDSLKMDVPNMLMFKRGIPQWLAKYVGGEYYLMEVRLCYEFKCFFIFMYVHGPMVRS